MSNTVEPEKVQQVAKLARIAISDETLGETAGQLNKILDYVQQLEAVKLPADVEPFFGAVESVNAIRFDDKLTEHRPRHNSSKRSGFQRRVLPSPTGL